jgi:flavodoxin
MKALIVYASWLGHTHAIAEALATDLVRQGIAATCVPVAKVVLEDVANYDLLVLGSFTPNGHASLRLRALCQSLPLRFFDRVHVAIFGTQMAEAQQHGGASGAQELMEVLAGRGVEVALPPLIIELPNMSAFRPIDSISADTQRRIKAFADELWEACVPAPF